MEDRESELKSQLANEKHRSVTLEKMASGRTGSGGSSYGASDARPSLLVKHYGDLYSQLRLETLDSLDRLPELVNSEELKNKLLFSVVVVRDAFEN